MRRSTRSTRPRSPSRSCKKAVEAFDAAMSDDLNTADALAVIFEHVRDMNTTLTADSAVEAIDMAARP